MFLIFLVTLMFAAFLPIILFASGETFGLPGLAVPGANVHGRAIQRAVGYGWTLIQLYIWLGWAAACAWVALRYATEAEVANPWIYYATALVMTGVPIAYVHRTDRMSATSDEERGHLQHGANLWRVLLLFGCMAFLIAPQLMRAPYGWLVHAERRITGDLSPEVTERLQAVQEQIVPSTAYGQPIVPAAAHPVLTEAPTTMMTPRRATGERHTASAGDARCEQEPSAERGPASERDTDGPCDSLEEPASHVTGGE